MSHNFHIEFNQDGKRLEFVVSGRIAVQNAGDVLKQFMTAINNSNPEKVILNLSNVNYFDGSGAAVMFELQLYCDSIKCSFEVTGMSDNIKKLISIIDSKDLLRPVKLVHPETPGMIVRIGIASIKIASDTKNMITFVGDTTLALMYAVIHPRCVRWKDVLFQFEEIGVNAVPILITIQFLIGVILAMLGASQLSQFGANVFIANLVAIAMVQELGPMLTAVIVTGRSGAAFAAEIGTMKVSEEIDALVSMGFNPQHFLVIPRLVATVLAMPCLLFIGDLAGIVGGAITSHLFFDMPFSLYMNQCYGAITMFIIILGLAKCIAFAILIAGVGCMRGFEVRGGAGSVGKSTTSAVVSAIFLIVVFNGLFTVIFSM